MKLLNRKRYTGKKVIKSCQSIIQVYETFINYRDLDEFRELSIMEWYASLSDPHVVLLLKLTYPSPWHRLLDALCEIVGIHKTFSLYDKLKKAVECILADPNYVPAPKDYPRLATKTPYYMDEHMDTGK